MTTAAMVNFAYDQIRPSPCRTERCLEIGRHRRQRAPGQARSKIRRVRTETHSAAIHSIPFTGIRCGSWCELYCSTVCFSAHPSDLGTSLARSALSPMSSYFETAFSSARLWSIWSYAKFTMAAVVIVSPLRASDSYVCSPRTSRRRVIAVPSSGKS